MRETGGRRMEEHPAQDFYDDLAGEYDLIFSDWDGEVGRQGEALGALLGRELGPRGLSVLDCSCGVGT
jgi:glycine/sarcosine N-methyltransferase